MTLGTLNADWLSQATRSSLPSPLVLLSGAEAEVWEQVAVQGQEPCGVHPVGKSVDGENVHLFAELGVTEGHLVGERLLLEKLHGLQVRVEVVHHGQVLLQQMFYVSKGSPREETMRAQKGNKLIR